MRKNILWQEWITADGIFSQETNSLEQQVLESDIDTHEQFQPTAAPAGDASPGSS